MSSDEMPTESRANLDRAFQRLADGEVEALDEIWRAVADDLYGLALWRCGSREEAADAVQEVFVRLATVAAERLQRVRDPRAYLLTMARRAACDQLRRRREHRSLDEALLETSPHDPEATAEARRLNERLRELPPAQRESLYLRTFLGMTFAEIGRISGVPTFTAASRCRNGLERLRRGLERRSRES